MKTLTIISPVYNEAEVIEFFYKELKKELEKIKDNYDSKILFVLDRSTDGSLEILKKIAQEDPIVQMIALSSRFGHQMSLLAGIDHTNSNLAIMMDCDLQHPPSLIPTMLKEFENGYDIVYTVRKDTKHISFFKRIVTKIFYRLINLVSDTFINENSADFRLISSRVLKVLQEQVRERNIFLRGIISWLGFNQKAITFTVQPRHAGKSKYSVSRLMRLGTYAMFSFSKKPLQASIFVGVLFAIFSFIYGIFTCIQYFLHHCLPSGWTTIIILLTGFSGLQFVFLGILGEYIGNIFDEVKGRPHYLVQEKINV